MSFLEKMCSMTLEKIDLLRTRLCSETAFSQRETRLGFLRLMSEHQGGGVNDAEQEPRAYHWLREAREPAKHPLGWPDSRPAIDVDALNQVSDPLDISSSKRVTDRLDEQPLLLIPATGSHMEMRHQRGIGLL
jgi:hypothetical protein